jgi:hypothetical protein
MLNSQYDYLFGVVALSQLPAGQFEARAASFVEENQWSQASTWDYIVDPVSAILNDIARPDMVTYLRRTYELDGLIHMLKLKAAMLHEGISGTSIAAFIPDSQYAFADVAGQEPIQWDAEKRRLYFYSQRDGERDIHHRLPFK